MQRLFDIKCLAVILTSLADGRVIEINEKSLTTLGYTRNEVIGRTTLELNIWACPQERETLVSMLIKDGKVENFVLRLRARNGQIITCQSSMETVVFDGQQCIICLGYITEAIWNNEKKYRDIVENTEIIIMQVDETGRILFVNEFGSLFFGYQPSELLASSFNDTLLPEYESTGRNLWELFKNVFANPASSKQVVGEAVKKDGRRVWIEWINHFQQDIMTGEVTVLTVGVDITARRRAVVSERKKVERRQRDRLFDDMIASRITEADFFRIVEESGFRLEPPFVCYMVVFNTTDNQLTLLKKDFEEWHAWVDTVIDLIYVRLGGLAWHTDHGIVILQHRSKKSSARSLHDARTWVAKVSHVIKDGFRSIEYMIGVSTTNTEIKTVYTQAYEAVRVGQILHPEKCIHYWCDLGVSRLLIEQAKSTAGMAFIRDYLGPLLEPSPRNEEWLMTLQEFISGDTMGEMAARLHIHPKTLAFRKRRIEKLLQIDIDDSEDLLNIAVALKLKKLRNNL